jgi:hypothetical protein
LAQIHKSGIRKSLAPRREPYWSRISRGQYIGFRKLPDGEGTWIARRRSDDGKQEYKSLGFDTEAFGIDQATAATEHWFKLKDSDIKDDIVTVADACRRYVEERRTSKSESCAHDAHKRFERTIYGRRHPKTDEVSIEENALGKRELAKIRASHIKVWRDGLDIGPAASNRHPDSAQSCPVSRSQRTQRDCVAGAGMGGSSAPPHQKKAAGIPRSRTAAGVHRGRVGRRP